MFFECESLKELFVSNFNTKKVTNMSRMFFKCKLLKEINISNFNTENVTNMNKIFADCFSLRLLNINNLILIMYMIWVIFSVTVLC